MKNNTVKPIHVIVVKTRTNRWKAVSLHPDSLLQSEQSNNILNAIDILCQNNGHRTEWWHYAYRIVNLNELPDKDKKNWINRDHNLANFRNRNE